MTEQSEIGLQPERAKETWLEYELNCVKSLERAIVEYMALVDETKKEGISLESIGGHGTIFFQSTMQSGDELRDSPECISHNDLYIPIDKTLKRLESESKMLSDELAKRKKKTE